MRACVRAYVRAHERTVAAPKRIDVKSDAHGEDGFAALRIMHVLNAHAEEGNGIVNVAIDLACLQARLGHDVAIVSRSGDFAELLRANAVRHFVLDQRRDVRHMVLAARRFRRMTREFRPHIVHAHTVTGVLLARALRARRRYRLVATVHNAFARSSRLMGFADRVIAISDFVRASLVRAGVRAAKISVVTNGPLGSPRRERDALDSATLVHPAIVSVAGLFERKGIAELLAAFEIVGATNDESHLYLVGDGPDRARFERIAAASRFRDRIHFEGFQFSPERYMRGCDLFVLASHTEPFGLVLAEARELGCAIVASNIDGIPQVLEDGRCGRLVPTRAPERLASAISELLADDALRAAYGARAASNLGWLRAERMNDDTLAVYRAELDGAPVKGAARRRNAKK